MEEEQLTGQNSNPDQIAQFHDDIRKIELEGYELRVRKARNALFLAAGIILLSEIIALIRFGGIPSLTGLLIISVIAGALIGLAFWTKKKPYTAIVTGIILYSLYIILLAAISGYYLGINGLFLNLVSGWIYKIVIYVALFRHLGDAKELQAALDENNN